MKVCSICNDRYAKPNRIQCQPCEDEAKDALYKVIAKVNDK